MTTDDPRVAERLAEYARLLAETSASVVRRLDEVRMPLHILLENHFGELNENQEEMLAAARGAAEEADAELRRLQAVAEIDQGALALRHDSIRLADVMAALRPTLESRAERAGARLRLEVAPGLPRVVGDPARLREALALLLSDRVRYARPDDTVAIAVEREAGAVRLRIDHGEGLAHGTDEALASRLIEAHGGTVETAGSHTEILLPSASAPSAPLTPSSRTSS